MKRKDAAARVGKGKENGPKEKTGGPGRWKHNQRGRWRDLKCWGRETLRFVQNHRGSLTRMKKKEREKVKIVMGSTENWDCAVKTLESPHSAMVEKKERQ